MNRKLGFVIVGEEKMHCGGCETRVINALKRVEGVREVAASAATQKVTVTLDAGGPDVQEIVARLAQLGYQAQREEPNGEHETIAQGGAR